MEEITEIELFQLFIQDYQSAAEKLAIGTCLKSQISKYEIKDDEFTKDQKKAFKKSLKKYKDCKQ